MPKGPKSLKLLCCGHGTTPGAVILFCFLGRRLQSLERAQPGPVPAASLVGRAQSHEGLGSSHCLSASSSPSKEQKQKNPPTGHRGSPAARTALCSSAPSAAIATPPAGGAPAWSGLAFGAVCTVQLRGKLCDDPPGQRVRGLEQFGGRWPSTRAGFAALLLEQGFKILIPAGRLPTAACCCQGLAS